MFLQLTSYQYPQLLSGGFAFLLLVYMISRRQVRGVPPLIFSFGAIALWSIGEALASAISDLSAKLFWFNTAKTGGIWLTVFWFIFILQFIRQGRGIKPHILILLTAIPFLSTILLWTNSQHLLFWRTIQVSASIINSFQTKLGPVGIVQVVYSHVMALTSVALVVQQMRGTRSQQRAQLIILLTCTILPWTAHFFYLLPLEAYFPVNPTPQVFLVTNGLFLYGMLRYRLLNIVPIDYQNMIAGMRDGILVLSLEFDLVHLNPAAEGILGRKARDVIGKPITAALSSQPELLAHCCQGELLEEVAITTPQGPASYEMHLSPLRDRYDYLIGHLIVLRNISKRVLAENASQHSQLLLKQSEEKYRALVENINEVIFTTGLDGIFTYISPVIERYTGFSPEFMLGKSFNTFVLAEDLPNLTNQYKQALLGQMQVLEYRVLNREGNILHVRTYTRPIVQDGKTVGLQGFVTDITEQKQVEQALERRASQLSILNFIGEQIAAMIELRSVLDSATLLIQKYFGYYHVAIFTPDFNRGELLLRSTSGAFSRLFPEDHHLKFGQGMVGWVAMNKNTLLANDVRLEPRYTNLYPDKILSRAELAVPILVGNKMVGVLDIQSPLVNAFDENDVRVMETVADQIAIAMENARLYEEVREQLKERERNENMLRIQRDLLVRLSAAKSLDETLQTAAEALSTEMRAERVVIARLDWKAQRIRPVAQLGFPGAPLLEPMPLDESAAGLAARSAQPALVCQAAGDRFSAGLSPDVVAQLCVPLIFNDQVRGVVCLERTSLPVFTVDELNLLITLASSLVMLIERARLFEEVTQARAELEKRAMALEEANANLRELDRIKSQFLANMSHELRTPLNSIIGFSEVLVDQLTGPLNEEQTEFVQDILDSGKHLLALINDVLDFSKIEAGRMALERSTFTVDQLFDELRSTISPLVEKKGQSLIFEKNNLLPALTADHLRIKQVFINLLSNANKFTPPGGQIRVSCEESGPGQLLFAIQDNGIGIREEDQEVIFEEFRQVDGSMTREVPGTGLGLSISKRIIDMHQGSIRLVSELGKGSTFYVCLPACPVDIKLE